MSNVSYSHKPETASAQEGTLDSVRSNWRFSFKCGSLKVRTASVTVYDNLFLARIDWKVLRGKKAVAIEK